MRPNTLSKITHYCNPSSIYNVTVLKKKPNNSVTKDNLGAVDNLLWIYCDKNKAKMCTLHCQKYCIGSPCKEVRNLIPVNFFFLCSVTKITKVIYIYMHEKQFFVFPETTVSVSLKKRNENLPFYQKISPGDLCWLFHQFFWELWNSKVKKKERIRQKII